MSDSCHCIKPTILETQLKEKYCDNCGLWFNEESWKNDPRMHQALKEIHRIGTKGYRHKAETKPYIAPPKVGRNDPCPCGSGKKYKKCCYV